MPKYKTVKYICALGGRKRVYSVVHCEAVLPQQHSCLPSVVVAEHVALKAELKKHLFELLM